MQLHAEKHALLPQLVPVPTPQQSECLPEGKACLLSEDTPCDQPSRQLLYEGLKLRMLVPVQGRQASSTRREMTHPDVPSSLGHLENACLSHRP